jgi:hypothetical protein
MGSDEYAESRIARQIQQARPNVELENPAERHEAKDNRKADGQLAIHDSTSSVICICRFYI